MKSETMKDEIEYELKEGFLYAGETLIGTVTEAEGVETLEHEAPLANIAKGVIRRQLGKDGLKFSKAGHEAEPEPPRMMQAREVVERQRESEPEPGTAEWAAKAFSLAGQAARETAPRPVDADLVPGTPEWAAQHFRA
jgi:hypothetical protein